MSEHPSVGSNTSWKTDAKPFELCYGATPRERLPLREPTSRLVACHEMTAHPVPNFQKLARGAIHPRIGKTRPIGWSESPQWVERIAPVGGANRPTTYGGVDRVVPPAPRPEPARTSPPGRATSSQTPPTTGECRERARVSACGDGGRASSRRRPDRRGPWRRWRARGRLSQSRTTACRWRADSHPGS